MWLSCTQCSKVYVQGDEEICALKKVTADFGPGVNVIIGKSGSGKTTFLKVISGLVSPTSGSVCWNDKTLPSKTSVRLKWRRKYTGFVFQSYNLVAELTAYDNIILPLLLNGIEVNKDSVYELAEELGIEKILLRRPMQLSGGEQQRVAIARAIIHDPSLIFADEPTGNLDAYNTANVIKILVSFAHEHQRNLLLVTHEQDWLTYADSVAYIEDGRLTKENETYLR